MKKNDHTSRPEAFPGPAGFCTTRQPVVVTTGESYRAGAHPAGPIPSHTTLKEA